MHDRLIRVPRSRLNCGLALALSLASCSRSSRQASQVGPGQELEDALRPTAAVTALRKLAGGHWHATASFRMGETSKSTDAGAPSSITTTTDLWMDKDGNFRLVESNDQGGKREVVRVAGELAVALSGGKLERRPSVEPEPTRLLEEALGAPWAAWDAVHRYAAVERDGGGLRIGRRSEPLIVTPATTPGRAWRDTVEVQVLDGQAQLHGVSTVAQNFTLHTRFTAQRDHLPIEGEIAVTGSLQDAGTVPAIVMPDADVVPTRQRTILDERALLGGLGSAASKGAP